MNPYHNLAGAINYKFPNSYGFWQVVQNHEGIFLTEWNESELGDRPTESIMLQWIEEFESLSDYERMSRKAKDIEDLRLEFIDKPQLAQLMKASPQTIANQINNMTVNELKILLTVLTIAVRKLIRQNLGE